MFRRAKTAETDVKKAIQKVLDNRKDNITRLKHLKIILESDPKEAKSLFEDNSSLVFYIFYDVFINVESDLKQRVNRAHKEELDTVLFVFEKVFLLVPELIHRRWQYNCIGRLIRKLLHPNNSIKIRREGVRLFLIWYQILRENASDECHELFSRLVPRLSPLPPVSSNSGSTGSVGTGGSSRVSTAPVSRQSHSRQGSGTLAAVAASHDAVIPVDSSPILPPQGHAEDVCEDYTLEFLRTLLHRMVSEVINIEWPEEDKPTRRRQALHFLMEQFKRFYLPVLFPPLPPQKSSAHEDSAVLYPGGPEHISILNRLAIEREGVIVSDIPTRKLILYQEEIIRWLAEFVYVGNKSVLNPSSGAGIAPGQLSEQDPDVSASVMDVSMASAGISGGADTTGVSGGTDGGSAASPGDAGPSTQNSGAAGGAANNQAPILREPEFPMSAVLTTEQVELVRDVLYATRENVLLIHELLSRTLSQFATMQHRAVYCVVTVYREWIRQAVKGHRPPFMREPSPNAEGDLSQDLVKGCVDDEPFRRNDSADQSVETEDDTVRDSDTDGSSMHTPSETSPAHRLEASQGMETSQSPSPDSVSTNSAVLENWLSSRLIAAGLQRCLQVIFTSSAHVFVLRTSAGAQYGVNLPTDITAEFLRNHEVICKMVLWFYRHATIQLTLSADTWEKLLMVLLRIVWQVMSSTSPEDTNSLGSLLAGPLFQTLIVTFVKANLHICVSRELWDNFMSVLSSLTHWPQLIVEWSKTMSTLTRLLAKHVYGLDLRDLPLDRHSKARSRRLNILLRSQHVASGPGSGGTSAAYKSRSHDRNQTIRSQRGLHRIQAFDHPNLQLADSFTCVKLEDSSAGPVRSSTFSENGGTGGLTPVSSSAPTSRQIGNNSSGFPSPSPSSASARASSRSSVDPSGGGGIGALFGTGGGGGLVDDNSSYASATEDTGVAAPESSGNSGATESNRGGQFDYQHLSTSTNTHGDSSSGCNVSLGFSDTELMSSSVIQAGSGRHPASDFSVSEETDSSVESDISSDNEVEAAVSISHRGRHRHLRHRRKPKNGKGGTLTRDDVSGMPLSEEDEEEEEGKEVEEEDRDAEDEEEDEDEDEETANGHSTGHGIKGQLNDLAVVSCSAERINTEDPDLLSVMAGGRAIGWTAENCVALWRRILCCLGDVNDISDPAILRTVYEHLSDIMHSLFNLRRNLGVSLDNVTTPAPPALIPPLFFMVPWFFSTLQLPPEFKQAKLLAMRLLCKITVSRHDLELPLEHIAQFHRQLHAVLAVDPDQDIVNEVLYSCGPKFFSLSIPGSCLLMTNLIEAAGAVCASTDRDTPRVEAVSILGSLLSFPTHYRLQGQASVSVLRSPAERSDKNGNSLGMQVSAVAWTEIQDCLVEKLIRWGSREPAGTAKAVALSSLGIFVYEELASYPGRSWKLHPHVKDAMKKLYEALRLSEKQVACDMLTLLVDHVELLLHELPDLPVKVVEQCSQALHSLMSERRDTSKSEKRLIVSLIFCLVEWCMNLPVSLLLDSTDSHSKGLIYPVFNVLHCVARGDAQVTPWKSSWLPQSHSGTDWTSLRQLEQLNQLQEEGEGHSAATSPSSSSSASQPGAGKGALRSPKLSSRDGLEMVRLAARTAISHLLNHLGQFPVTSAACLDSFVQEWQEVDLLGLDVPLSDLTPGLFEAPNLQMFTVNDCALLSLLTIPRPDRDAEDGLLDGSTLVRAIVRDVGGKYCWDARVLYGSSVQTPSPSGVEVRRPVASQEQPSSSAGDREDVEEEEKAPTVVKSLHADQLRELLAALEKSSPELCLQPPSKPAPSLDEASAALEEVAKQQLHAEEMWEDQTLLRLDSDSRSHPRTSTDDGANAFFMSPFYACRHVLSQLGFFAWERRPHIDLLKKKDNLLLELKNLDMRACRETHKIAVIYVGPGQEDKQSVLSNAAGSRGFEDFVAGLGWEVVLDRHPGFRGGLPSSGRTGLTTPYYATSTLEMIFHVATRMPSDTEEDRHRKLKHLGNDEIWLVWSEHERDFRRGLIPTEFGDVMIIVYPLPDRAGLFRVAIDRKPEIPFFGPLFDGVVVSDRVLPGLVRATAINASRVNRALKQGYLTFYEERARCLDDIIQRYKKSTTFESFARHCFAPILPDDGVVPNSPTDHADGTARFTGAMRTTGEPSVGAAGVNEKKEGKSKVKFPPSQLFFGDNFPGSLSSSGVVMRSNSPSTTESDSKPSIVRRLSMKTRRTRSQAHSLKRQSSPTATYSPPTSSPVSAGTSPRHKTNSPISKDSL